MTESSSSSSNTNSGGGSSNPPTTNTSITDADLAFCMSETNRFRAMQGKTTLARSAALEAYGADSARIDQQANQAHQHYTSTNGGGVSLAENEVLSVSPNAVSLSTQNAIQFALSLFYSEGPGGGHFQNMMGSFSSVGCGVYRGTTITVAQEFR